jgi:glucose-6-phosphate 1-epimerase
MSENWRVENGTGENDLPIVTLSGTNHSAQIYLHGATITSWKHFGEEKIFVSSLTHWNGVKAIRGGVPVVWPQFGQPDTSMPQHGQKFTLKY